MKNILIPLNIKNKNGRTYAKRSFVDMQDCYLVELNPSTRFLAAPNVDLSKVKGVVNNVVFEENALVGDLTMLDVPLSKEILELVKSGDLVIRPIAEATCNLGVVHKAHIKGFQFIPKEEDSFNI